MPLTLGTHLGTYEILSPIGAGGMGEVYCARDTKLGREVAVKVLPEAFSQNKERLARFEREARLLASLNHPGIATLHELEECNGVHYLVMELVEGETLGEQIAQGPIPVEEALPLFKQIAGALGAAHAKGIVHRDLKPANIKVTPEGNAKVLDFGLAKAFGGEFSAGEQSKSPTITREGTETGVILGTAAYMSPEQARGKPLDKRTDIWSFGCVLYEALTGKVAFLGETVPDTIARILEREPDWQSLPENTPAILRSLMRHCLKKDPNQRVHDVSDARILIEEALTEPSESLQTVGVAGGGRERRARAFIIMALVTIVAVAIALWSFMRSTPPAPLFPTRLVVDLLPNQRLLETVGSLAIALSPDGTRLLYVAESGGRSQLYLRSIDQFEARPIAGTEGAHSPFFSADGQWVGFYANGRLQKVSVTGGAALAICDTLPVSHGASWGPDGTIIFAVGEPPRLMRVSAAGGTPQALPAPELGRPARWPQVLPDGSGVLSTLVTDDESSPFLVENLHGS